MPGRAGRAQVCRRSARRSLRRTRRITAVLRAVADELLDEQWPCRCNEWAAVGAANILMASRARRQTYGRLRHHRRAGAAARGESAGSAIDAAKMPASRMRRAAPMMTPRALCARSGKARR